MQDINILLHSDNRSEVTTRIKVKLKLKKINYTNEEKNERIKEKIRNKATENVYNIKKAKMTVMGRRSREKTEIPTVLKSMGQISEPNKSDAHPQAHNRELNRGSLQST